LCAFFTVEVVGRDFSDFPDDARIVHSCSRVFCEKKKVPEN
jgi:hypothetical protein